MMWNLVVLGFVASATNRNLWKMLLGPTAKSGEEPLGSVGNDTPPAAFSDLPRSSFDFFYQLCAQVTNRPIESLL